MFAPGITYPINTDTPRDGRRLLVFGTAGWETLDNHRPESLGWHIVVWDPALSVDYSTGDFEPVGGFKTVSMNPHADYVIATHWQVYPEEPAS